MEEQEADESFASEEEDEDDGYGEDEPQFVQDSPSFEALQPYPRDVSIEPSPDPAKVGFESPVAPVSVPGTHTKVYLLIIIILI